MVLEDHGGEPGIRDENLLASALNRPIDKYNYESKCTIYELAPAYSFRPAKNHPFVDSNKRAAFLAGTVFHELKGMTFKPKESDAAFVFERLAAGKEKETSLVKWLKKKQLVRCELLHCAFPHVSFGVSHA